jgi:tripartite-type tricarboxylate transporter receptor subunit TctC
MTFLVRLLRGWVVGLAGCVLALQVMAQAYPSKPIKLIVPFPPGGGVDLYARLIQSELSRLLGQPVTIDNRTGASGMIGSDAVAKATPDGYTLLVGNVATYAMNVATHRKMPYDPLKDLSLVIQTVMLPYVLVVNPNLPVHSVTELLAYTRSHPGQVSYSSSGSGSAQHMAAELFKSRSGADLTHVPYKGVGAMVSDLIAGHVQVAFADMASMLPHIKAGKLRLLAVTSPRRIADFPETPTVEEAAQLSGFEISGWQGIAGPSGLPQPMVKRLNDVFNQIQSSPAMREKFKDAGLVPVGGTPEEFQRYMQSEITKWSKVAKDIGAVSE